MAKKKPKTTKSRPSAHPIADRIKPAKALVGGGGTYSFYGRSGTGKTTLASTFPKPVLVLDINEEGHDSVSDVEGVYYIQITEWDDIEAVYWYLAEGDHGIQTVVIDTVTAMQELGMVKVKIDDGREPDDDMSKRLWGNLSTLMKQWLMAYRNLSREQGMHVVFLSQDRVEDVDEDDEGYDELDPQVGPAVTPSVAKALNAMVKVIGQTYIREVTVQTKSGKVKTKTEYRLRLGPHPYYITKIRSPRSYKVPASIKDPTFEKIQTIITGGATTDGEEEGQED